MSFEPISPWHLVVLVLVATVISALVIAQVGSRRMGRRGAPIVLLAAGVCLALFLAALNPIVGGSPGAAAHLVLLVDVSQSVQRGAESWPEVRQVIAEALHSFLQELAPQVRRTGTASLLTLGRDVRSLTRDMELEDLPAAVSRLTEEDFPPTDASYLEAGLRAAAARLEKAGRGAVLLVSDGHETKGDARAAAAELGQRGFSVHIVALGSRAPEVGLYAADLPPRVETGVETWARLLLVNRSLEALPLELSLRRASLPPYRRRAALPTQGWAHLRQALTLEDPGLTFVDLELAARGGERQSRRFFTYVAAPPRILAVGDDHSFTRALPAERFRLETVSPENLGGGAALGKPFDPSLYDAVLLHEVWATRLQQSHLEAMAEAAETSGLGILLINGPELGGPEAETMLMSYDGTALEALLPVINRPRPVRRDPPPRQIVILVDTSGSMSGWPLRKAKQIAAAIISRLRAADRLHLIAFTGGAHPVLSDLAMTQSGKEEALQVVGSLRSGGGTDPSQALSLIADRRLSNCGLFMISDGEFQAIRTRPDCEATVFAIGKGPGRVPAVLGELAEPFPVPDDSFNPAAIRISFFDPKPRNNRFEPGRYTPVVGVDAFEGGWSLLPDPALPLSGNAVTHAREDAEVAAMRPRPRDPVLAFRDTTPEPAIGRTGGTVGALTTRLPPSYYNSTSGARAITAWVERLLAHSQRDRYAFRLEEKGEVVGLRLEILSQNGRAPRIDSVSVSVDGEMAGGTDRVAVRLRPDVELEGVFNGDLRLQRGAGENPRPTRLVVRESGPDALRRPQRIPFLIPPLGDPDSIAGAEAWRFGLDLALLHDLADLTGGHVLEPGEAAALIRDPGEGAPGHELRAWLLGVAMVLLLVQIAVRRTSP